VTLAVSTLDMEDEAFPAHRPARFGSCQHAACSIKAAINVRILPETEGRVNRWCENGIQ